MKKFSIIQEKIIKGGIAGTQENSKWYWWTN